MGGWVGVGVGVGVCGGVCGGGGADLCVTTHVCP